MLIFINGADSYLAHQALAQLKERYLAKNTAAELLEIDATTTTPNWADLQAVPLFASSRLVIIKETTKLPVGEQGPLARVLANLPSTTVVAVWANGALKDANLISVLNNAKIIKADPLVGQPLANWLNRRAQELNVQLSPSVKEQLLENSHDLWQLENELKTLSLSGELTENQTRLKTKEPFIYFQLLRRLDWPQVRRQLAADLKVGEPIELIIGSLAAAGRQCLQGATQIALTDLLMDVDVGLKTGLLDEAAAIAILVSRLGAPEPNRVEWETVWEETAS